MKKISNNFISEIGTFFAISGEMISQNGEDSFIYSFNENKGLIGVFDGCGGIGSRRYQTLNSKTGAYISARAVSECVAKWFDNYSERDYTEDKTKILAQEINDTLGFFKSKTTSSKIKGSMTKDFPTTLSMAVLENVNNELIADFIWAGDSRGYILGEQGLVQITRDDIDESVDALDNISSDGVLTNVISADTNYILHSKPVTIKKKCIIFNSTDGCFGYLKTPMEFEYLILYTLMTAESVNEWKTKLENSIREFTGDDHTISLAAYGFKSFNEMQIFYQTRTDFLYEHYIKHLKNCTKREIEILWNKYKKVYYGKV